MKKVLITGGAGFIGLHLARRLVGRYQVDLVDNFARGENDTDLQAVLRSSDVHLMQKNLLDDGALKDLGNDYVFIYHLAAIIGVAHVAQAPYRVLDENTLLLSRVIELARRQAALERLVFASTSEVYAGTLEHFGLPFPTPEETPLAVADLSRPRTTYMLSKIHGEALCHHSQVPFSIVRPHNVYGPRMGNNHVIPELVARLSRSSEVKVFSPHHQRVFCYIDDAVALIERIAESREARGGTFNIGSPGPEICMKDLAALIARVMEKNARIVEGEVTQGSPARRFADIEKTVRLTGHKTWVGLEEGVRRTYEWYKLK
ncbi:MAG: NAD-dependent epimerase/dehydratase family protein [Candidatus Omnitrophica bacterium]|nr:NAD-dependent epimerase/dehydratase family protein [Candidatus Omnitrophota bacterium]